MVTIHGKNLAGVYPIQVDDPLLCGLCGVVGKRDGDIVRYYIAGHALSAKDMRIIAGFMDTLEKQKMKICKDYGRKQIVYFSAGELDDWSPSAYGLRVRIAYRRKIFGIPFGGIKYVWRIVEYKFAEDIKGSAEKLLTRNYNEWLNVRRDRRYKNKYPCEFV